MAPTLSVDEVAARLCVDRDTVGYWIANKELSAINVAKFKDAKRARWRITEESLALFETMRQTITQPKRAAKTKSKFEPVRRWSDEM
jgi:excisionase family DNA binding protein